MYILVVPSLSTKFIKNSYQNCQFSLYLGTKLDMLLEIAKSVETALILGKQLFYPKIIDFMQKILFCCYLCPHKLKKNNNFFHKLA